jgi:two-component system, sensor histidine kinase and response regulator
VLFANREARRLLGVAGPLTRLAAAGPFVREDGRPFPAGEDPWALAKASQEPTRRIVGISSGETVRWVLVAADPVRAAEGRAGPVVLTLVDLTDRYAVEQALRRSEESFRRIVESAADVIYRTDAEGRFVYANAGAGRLLDLEANEIVGRHYLEPIRPDYREDAQRFYEQQARERTPHTYCEFPVLTPSGREAWIGQNVQILSDGDRITGFQAVARDITERRRAEEALERERAQLRQIVFSAPVAVALFDAEQRCVAHSERWLAEQGLSGRSILARGPTEAFGCAPERWEAILAQAIEGVALSSREESFRRRDGSNVYMRWAAHPWRRADSTVAGVIVVVEPIDDLVRARIEAVEASRLKSEFLATMSHEIRTPMSGVIGLTRLLLETELTHEQWEHVRTIHSSGQALLSIINDILDFSKVEAGRLALESIDFDLHALVDDVVQSFAERARGRGTELLCLVRHDVPSALRGDPGRVRQVLVNLIDNALKFTERGEVMVRVAIGDTLEGRVVVRFEVSDTGRGIDAAAQTRLFEPFVQAEASTARKFGGTGLGLAISKRLVEMMGGRIGASSELGRGSQFWFTAPIETRPEPAPGPEPTELEGVRVLVVDDHTATRDTLRRQLSAWRTSCDAAASPLAAVEALGRAAASGAPYSVVIVDLNRPGTDGLAFARAVREQPAHAEARVVLLTSVGLVGQGAEAARAGLSGYLTKPVRPDDLRDCLLAALGRAAGGGAEGLVTRHTIKEARRRRAARVLVVEDDEVNQKVAARILESLGYRADIAVNGRDALVAVERARYAAILMDGQMPEMDGYEATAEIRRREGERRRTPIIALTAAARDADRERCLRAGMDDYVSKPVSPEALDAVLQTWIPRAGEARPAASRSPSDDAGALLDRTALARLAAVDGKGELLAEVIALFLTVCPRRLGEMTDALSRGDARALETAAHSFKGACANVGARRPFVLCSEVEALAGAGRSGEASPLLAMLAAELEALRPALEAELAQAEGRPQAPEAP